MTTADRRKSSDRRISYLGYGAYSLLGWSSVLFASLIGQIESTFGKSDADIGVLLFFGALFYGISGLGGGFLSEWLGSRRVLMAAFLILAASMLGQGLTAIWWAFALCLVSAQLGKGAIDAGFGALFLDAFAERRGVALNHLHLFYGVGALFGPAVVGILITVGASWRLVYLATMIMALAGFWSVSQLNLPGKSSSETVANPHQTAEITASERSLSPFICLAAAMMCYEAQVAGMTFWIVRFLDGHGVGWSTGALTAYWVGLSFSRLTAAPLLKLASSGVMAGTLLAGSTLAYFAVLASPWIAVTVVILVVAGYLSGPIYPLFMSIGGDMYPNRLDRLAGGLTGAATLGVLTVPPLIGIIATNQGIRSGMVIAAAIGIPGVFALTQSVRAENRIRQATI